ncbi:MAG: hypothetical protein KGM47_00640, partial [Acidobacteriota bacterium]|nr:hypothetical protein [Acidobacteriota bacterium]
MNMGPGFWDSSDLRSLSGVANDLGYFFYSTGSPSFDSSHMSTTLINVPSPGTAASVLFQQPQQAQVQGAYNAAINYGLNVTWGGWTEISAVTGVAQAGYINGLPNWSSSNPLYQLTAFTSSQAFWDGASALVAAAEYFDFYLITGSANIGPGLDQATCDKLRRFAEVAGGIALIALGVGFIFPPLAPFTTPIAMAVGIWAGIVEIIHGLMCF